MAFGECACKYALQIAPTRQTDGTIKYLFAYMSTNLGQLGRGIFRIIRSSE